MCTGYQISKKRKADLEREKAFLQTTRSREVEAFIAEAMRYGDLENNAEYEAAMLQQKKVQGRIAEIEKILSCAVVVETEQLHFSEDFLAELRKSVQACGLSANQAERYAQYCRIRFEQEEQRRFAILPDGKYLETLKEAQRILSGKPNPSELSEDRMDRFLQIPCDQWQSTKARIVECFGCSKDTVDALFSEDEEWLFVSPDSVVELASYLKERFSDIAVVWNIFRSAALLGVNTGKSRIEAVLDILGEEVGKKVISADAEANAWLFYRYYTDPVGCIAYMKECGLTPERILNVVQQDPDILYFYKEGRRLSYYHNQEQIDRIIQRYK